MQRRGSLNQQPLRFVVDTLKLDVRVYDDSNTQDIMEIPVNNGTSIVASLKEQLEPKDNISGVCTDQPAYDNDVSVSEEEFY
ncbi:hypothetical protein ABFA07_013431 [Porites harrisoni]